MQASPPGALRALPPGSQPSSCTHLTPLSTADLYVIPTCYVEPTPAAAFIAAVWRRR